MCLCTVVETFPDAFLALEWQLFLTAINRGSNGNVGSPGPQLTGSPTAVCKYAGYYIEVWVFQGKGLLSPQYFSYYDNYMLQERIK